MKANVLNEKDKLLGKAIDLGTLNENDRLFVESYRVHVQEAIKSIVKNSGRLKNLHNLIQQTANLEDYLMRRLAMNLIKKRPSPRTVRRIVIKTTKMRMNSWWKSLYRQEDHFQACTPDYIVERNEEGQVIAFALPQTGWTPPLDLPNPFIEDPLASLLHLEEHLELKKIPDRLRKIKSGNSKAYSKVMSILLSYRKLTLDDVKEFGIDKPEKLASIKHHAIKNTKKKMAKIFPEVKEKQAIANQNKKKSFKALTSTFNKRNARRIEASKEEYKSGKIRHFKVYEGGSGKAKNLQPLLPNQSESSAEPSNAA